MSGVTIRTGLSASMKPCVKVEFLKLDKNAVIPSYKSENAAGFDFTVLEDVTIGYGETKTIRTGLAVKMSMVRMGLGRVELQIRPRSGVSLNTNLRIANSPGTIDQDYTGEILIIAQNMNSPKIVHVPGVPPLVQPGDPIVVKAGTRIAQGIVDIIPPVVISEVFEIESTNRGNNGFGSTGV